VGGQKVYPAEVEAVLLDCPEIIDAFVFGESNPILGKIVCANLVLREGCEAATARNSMRQLYRDRLQAYMVPIKVKFVDEIPHSHRLKRLRPKL
jgi:acyl-coenzyme A synthetase/AMP-(fatty) acid ligase